MKAKNKRTRRDFMRSGTKEEFKEVTGPDEDYKDKKPQKKFYEKRKKCSDIDLNQEDEK